MKFIFLKTVCTIGALALCVIAYNSFKSSNRLRLAEDQDFLLIRVKEDLLNSCDDVQPFTRINQVSCYRSLVKDLDAELEVILDNQSLGNRRYKEKLLSNKHSVYNVAIDSNTLEDWQKVRENICSATNWSWRGARIFGLTMAACEVKLNRILIEYMKYECIGQTICIDRYKKYLNPAEAVDLKYP